MEATTNKYKRIKGINKTVPLYYKSKSVDNENAIKITYNELVKLRDNSQLIPGAFYRIIDYTCITSEGVEYKSAQHQFDIILVAINENTLSEEGWATEHKFNTLEHEYMFTDSDNVSKKVYAYIRLEQEAVLLITSDKKWYYSAYIESVIIDENNKTIKCAEGYITIFRGFQRIETFIENDLFPELYFINSNLNAWKVWYCLDNDINRFKWAVPRTDRMISYDEEQNPTEFFRESYSDIIIDNIQYYSWLNDNDGLYYLTKSDNPKSGDKLYRVDDNDQIIDTEFEVSEFISIEGKGVIYRLIDEYDNDCPYDFKNILFSELIKDGKYNQEEGEETYVYTFNYWNEDNNNVDLSILHGNIMNSNSEIITARNNKIKGHKYETLNFSGGSKHVQALPFIVFLVTGYILDGVRNNTILNSPYTFIQGNDDGIVDLLLVNSGSSTINSSDSIILQSPSLQTAKESDKVYIKSTQINS